MPRGIRETQFFVLEEPKKPGKGGKYKPIIHTFATTPQFKAWISENSLSMSKQSKSVMWLEFPDTRYALAFKGHNIACINGRVLI